MEQSGKECIFCEQPARNMPENYFLHYKYPDWFIQRYTGTCHRCAMYTLQERMGEERFYGWIAEYCDIHERTPLRPPTKELVAVTISPQNCDNPAVALDIIEKLKTFKFISDCYFIIEQRSDDPEKFHGFHLHGRCVSTYPPSKVQQFINQKLSGKKAGLNSNIKCKKIVSSGWEAYLSGEKDGEKEDKVNVDKIMRQTLQIPEFFKW